MSDHKNHNLYNDLDAEKANVSGYVLFDDRQWNYIQHRYRLTPRERDIMEDVCKGLRNDDIAKDVNIALGTVKTHIRNVHRKTQTRSKIAILLKFIHDVDVFFKKQEPTLRTPITEAQKPSNANSSDIDKAKSKDQ